MSTGWEEDGASRKGSADTSAFPREVEVAMVGDCS